MRLFCMIVFFFFVCDCLFVSASDAVFFCSCFHCFFWRALHDVFVCLPASDAATLLFFVVLFLSASYGAFLFNCFFRPASVDAFVFICFFTRANSGLYSFCLACSWWYVCLLRTGHGCYICLLIVKHFYKCK